MTLTLAYLLAAALAPLCAYLGRAHQTLWPGAARHRAALRAGAWASGLAAAWAAVAALGTWAGLSAALTAWMLAAVAWPYLDAWLRLRRARGG